jgi:hypothetical protein
VSVVEPDDRLPAEPPPGPEDEARRFAREWDEIVTELTHGPDPIVPEAPEDPTSGDRGAGPPSPGTTAGLEQLFRPLRRQEPSPQPAPDEDHFVPPPPPDLPEGTPIHRLAWAGTLGGPALLVGAALVGYDLPRAVYLAAGIAALAGFATLVWLLPDAREDSGWDDGAQL